MEAEAVMGPRPGMVVVVVVLPVAVKAWPAFEKVSVMSDCIFHSTGPLLPWQAS